MDRTMTKVLVGAAGEFIGGHLAKRLKRDGFRVQGVDLKYHELPRGWATPTPSFLQFLPSKPNPTGALIAPAWSMPLTPE